MVLAKVNKELVSHVESLGVQAVGISGKDGGLLKCKKKYSNGEDIGFVWGYYRSKTRKFFMICWKKIFFRLFFQSDLMIIMTAITLMQMMQPAQLQRLYMQRSLHFFPDIEGVYRDKDDPSSLISELHIQEARKLIRGWIC